MKAFLATFFLISISSFAFSQPKKDKPTPAPTPSGEPTLTTPVTLGLLRGKTADIELTGTNLKDVTTVAVIGCKPDVVTAIKSSEANKLIVSFSVPEKAPIGLYQLRIAGPNGISAYRPIVIDSVPTLLDNGKNQRPADAQPIPGPCVVIGSIANETADYYRISVKAKQTVTFDCFAKRLGSALDPVIILGDAKTGRELSSLYADDTPGLQSDARFVHTFPADGEYFVMVRDTTYKGGDKFDYRLRITEGEPQRAFPHFRKAGSSIESTGDAWPATMWESVDEPQVEHEPNDTNDSANSLPANGLTARFDKKNDKDCFSFMAKKGEKWEVTAKTAEIGSPCEVLIKIQDASGKTLAESDPQKTVAKAEFTAAADGQYFAVCEHLNFLFGPLETYHIQASMVKPSHALMLGSDRVLIPEGQFGLIPIVSIDKRNGFDGPIPFEGSKTIPAIASKENPIYWPVRTKSQAGLATITIPNASAADVCRSGLNGLSYLPPGWADRIAVMTVPAAPVTLTVETELSLKAGEKKSAKVTAKRKAFDGDIALSLLGLPANVTAKSITLPGGQSDIAWEILADAKAVAGQHFVYVKGQVGEKFTYSNPISLTVTSSEKPMDPKAAPPKKK